MEAGSVAHALCGKAEFFDEIEGGVNITCG
jgi:hypothetical protein